jgi:hypothetical protein
MVWKRRRLGACIRGGLASYVTSLTSVVVARPNRLTPHVPPRRARVRRGRVRC